MSEDLYEPIKEATEEDSLRAQVAALQSALELSQKTELGLRERLLNLTVELETIKELYEEGLNERVAYRVKQRHTIRKLRDDFQAQLNSEVSNLRTQLNNAINREDNVRGELAEALEKFAAAKTKQREAERTSDQQHADIIWLLALLHNGFQLGELLGSEISPMDVTTARTRTVVLPSKLTKGKVKQLFS